MRDVIVPVGRTNEYLGRTLVLEFARRKLCQFGAAYQRQYDVRGKSLFYSGFHAERVCGIDENAGMLGCDD